MTYQNTPTLQLWTCLPDGCFIPVVAKTEQPRVGDYVFNHGELCRFVPGRHERVAIHPVDPGNIAAILRHFYPSI